MFAESIILGNTLLPSNNAVGLAHTSDGAGNATIYSAWGFVATGKTLDKIRIYCTAVTNLSSIVCEIRPEKSTGGCDTNGTSLATVTKTTGLPTGAGWVEFSGFNLATTAGRQYYAVLYNNSVGTTPSITYQYHNGTQNQFLAGSSSSANFNKIHGTNGSTFATAAGAYVSGITFIYTDGTRQGLPTQVVSSGAASGFYSGAETGMFFTVDNNTDINVAGVTAQMSTLQGTPTGNVVFKLYENSALIYTSANLIAASLAFTRTLMAPLDRVLRGGRSYRAVFTLTAGDSTNYCRMMFHQLDTAAMPYQALMLDNLKLTKNTGSGWVDTDYTYPSMNLILHSTTPFYPAPINRRRITNQR